MTQLDGMSRRQKAAFKAQLDDLATILATEAGRRFVRALLENAGVFRAPTSMEEAAVQAFGHGIIAQLEAISPITFPRIMLEAANERVKAQVTDEKERLASHYDGEEDDE